MTDRPVLEMIDGTKLDETAYNLLRDAIGGIEGGERTQFHGVLNDPEIGHLGQGLLYVTIATYHGPYRLSITALPSWEAAQRPPEPDTATETAEPPVETPRTSRPSWMDARDRYQAEVDAEIREPVSAVERCPDGHDIEECTCTPSWERDGDAV